MIKCWASEVHYFIGEQSKRTYSSTSFNLFKLITMFTSNFIKNILYNVHHIKFGNTKVYEKDEFYALPQIDVCLINLLYFKQSYMNIPYVYMFFSSLIMS